MRRLACVLALLVLAGCQDGGSGVDEQLGELESTVATIESELADD